MNPNTLNNIIQLARLDKPAGWLLLMHPCWWAVILAGEGTTINYYFLFLFTIGAIAMRSAGCIINDIWDRKIDAQVERTKNRPLASGAIKVWQAVSALIIFLFAGLFVFLELNEEARKLSLCAFALAIFYPLMKRFFFLPQLFLGIAFNLGALIAWVAIKGEIEAPASFLYLAGIFWTLGYDTIYGHQDIKDDKKIGVKSTPITFGKMSIFIILTCYLWVYIFLAVAGVSAGYNFTFITLIPVIFNLIRQIFTVKLHEPESCLAKFKWNAYVTGFLVSLGLILAKYFEI